MIEWKILQTWLKFVNRFCLFLELRLKGTMRVQQAMDRIDVLWFRRIHVDFSDRHLSDRWLSRTVYGTVLSIRCRSVDWFWTAENQDPEEKGTPCSNESVILIDSYLTGSNGLLNIPFSSMDDIVLIVDSQINGFDAFVDFNQSSFFRRCQNAVLLFQTFGEQSTLFQ